MRWIHLLAGLMVVGLFAAVGLLIAEEQTKPAPYCLGDDVQFGDDVQYFPSGPSTQPPGKRQPAQAGDAVLGDLLFTDVVSVHFIGPALPANSDGSLGGLAVGDDRTQMRIYERFIVREATDSEGRIYRTLYAYETLGKIEQRLERAKADTKP